MTYTATYSPDDNKLRLYAGGRLDAETYAKVKAAGFRWAPKQELFVAPAWSPAREDLLIELAGEIGDEDTSLVDRAAERAERFEGYRENRAADAESARQAVSAIADNIPFGQPILVGHHSEKRARRDAEKIETGMRRAVKMWETSVYWQDRAKGAIRHAKHKERPDVRARRIKGLEADVRRQQRSLADAAKALRIWSGLRERVMANRDTGAPLSFAEKALLVAGHTNTAPYQVYSDLVESKITAEEAQAKAISAAEGMQRWAERWLAHLANRLTYERAMLAESGGTAADKTGPEKGGACQCWTSPGRFGANRGWSYIVKVNKVSVTVLRNWGNPNDRDGSRNFTQTMPFDKLTAVMTAAQVQAARDEGRLVETSDKTGFFLTGAVPTKAAPKPDTVCPDGPSCQDPECQTERTKQGIENIRATLKAGVQVVTAPQLFPTPMPLARRMVELADIEPQGRVLEPSAGTGNLVDAILRRAAASRGVKLLAVEINRDLAADLARFQGSVTCADFLTCRADPPLAPESVPPGTPILGRFDRVVMNPPFANGHQAADIVHIKHALTMLKPGGRLVALCADGPRQQAELRPLADSWESLGPAFESEGTGARVALLVITKEEE